MEASDDLKLKPFSDEELKFKRENQHLVGGSIGDLTEERFLATVAARDKRIEEREEYIQDRQSQPVYDEGYRNGQDAMSELVCKNQAATIERLRGLIQSWKDGFEKAPVVELDIANKIYQISAELIEDLIEQARQALKEG